MSYSDQSEAAIGSARRVPSCFSRLLRIAGLTLLALLVTGVAGLRADEIDEKYLAIFNVIDQADTLKKAGQSSQALAKYREAQTALMTFQREHRDWKAKMVAYRLDYVSGKITTLTEAASTPETTTPAAREAGKTAAPAPASTSPVKLLEAGTEPRVVLKLHPQPGAKQTVDMTFKVSMNVKMGEMNQQVKLPAMKMTTDVTVKSVAPSGDITFEIVVADFTIVQESDTLPAVAEAIKAATGGIKGVTGSGVVTCYGLTKNVDLKVPAGDSQTSQIVEQVKEMFSKSIPQLPQDPVGAGARWEIKMPVKSQGVQIDQGAAYQLVSIEGERVTTKETFTQHAANQKVPSPLMPGMKADLTKLTGKGSGDTTFELSRLMPVSSVMDAHSETTATMTMAGQKQAMTSTTDANIRLESK